MKISANGIEVHYSLEGPRSAPVVMMSHSLATDAGMWDPQAAMLARAYRVLRYDTRGHGATDAPSGPYSLEMLTGDAHALTEALGIGEAHWVGISMGGMIGQMFALMYPQRLLSLSLCDTMCVLPPEALGAWRERIDTAESEGMEPLVAPTIDRWFSPEFVEREPAAVDRIRDTIRATPVAGYVGCSHAIMQLNLTTRLREIDMPTLIVVGEDDPGTPVAASEQIHAEIADSRLVILPGARHLSNLEAAPGFNAALSGFLEDT
ncbi:MAG: alpha/beta fold hydrolase [Gammaproteobacteria bacterium]